MRSGIALGSNLSSGYGDRAANLTEALRRLSLLGQVVAVSSFHDTDPVGYLDQPQFLNAAALLDSPLPPLELLEALLGIEREMGRRRDLVPAKGPRIIDLDLLFAGNVTLEKPKLTLPHPAMAERAFVLAPLAEIAPEWVHPSTGLTVREMLARLG